MEPKYIPVYRAGKHIKRIKVFRIIKTDTLESLQLNSWDEVVDSAGNIKDQYKPDLVYMVYTDYGYAKLTGLDIFNYKNSIISLEDIIENQIIFWGFVKWKQKG